jgi:hypothetical protein
MPKRRDFKKEEVVAAMAKTKSNRAAARYLNCSYQHYKKWAKFYKDENGVSLFDKHKNQCGKGIPKFLSNSPFGRKEPALLDIIEGRIDAAHFSPQKIKYRMLEQGYLKEECGNCGFHERRVLDYKVPLIMHFKDGNKQHYNLGNVQLLCYNCYFLYVADIFTDKQVDHLEDHVPHMEKQPTWEVDEYHLKRLEELGLNVFEKDDDDPYSLVSRKK